MKGILAAAVLFGLAATPSAYAQAWIGQIAGEAAANAVRAHENSCMRGELPPPSERRLSAVRDGAHETMARYLALAAGAEDADLTTVFSNRRARSWEYRLTDGSTKGQIEAINDPLARTVGATLSEPQTILVAGDGATAAGQWAIQNAEGQAIGHYRGIFRRERRAWRLLHLEVFDAETTPAPLVNYCHVPGDVAPPLAAPVAMDVSSPKSEQTAEPTTAAAPEATRPPAQ